jgi:hypothetical protein
MLVFRVSGGCDDLLLVSLAQLAHLQIDLHPILT